MTTSIKRSPYITPRSGKAYRLELEGRTIFLLVGLMILTGGVIFVLGITTGMGMRDPGQAVPVVVTPPPAQTEESAAPASEKLAFSEGVKTPAPVLEGLKINQDNYTNQTRTLLNRAEKELDLEEIPTRPLLAPSTSKQSDQTTALTAETNKPATPLKRAKIFTVQVFSSKRQSSAQELVNKLKKQGFKAYMNQYQGPNQEIWYRVRVGKTDKLGAEELVRRLKRDAKLKSPQIIQQ